MRGMTYLDAMMKANRQLRQEYYLRHKTYLRTFRQAQKFERRLRAILRERDELREIKAQ